MENSAIKKLFLAFVQFLKCGFRVLLVNEITCRRIPLGRNFPAGHNFPLVRS